MLPAALIQVQARTQKQWFLVQAPQRTLPAEEARMVPLAQLVLAPAALQGQMVEASVQVCLAE